MSINAEGLNFKYPVEEALKIYLAPCNPCERGPHNFVSILASWASCSTWAHNARGSIYLPRTARYTYWLDIPVARYPCGSISLWNRLVNTTYTDYNVQCKSPVYCDFRKANRDYSFVICTADNGLHFKISPSRESFLLLQYQCQCFGFYNLRLSYMYVIVTFSNTAAN